MSNTRLNDATQHAEKLVRDEKLELPIDLIALAKSRDILVEAKPESAKGVSGMLLQVGNSFAIGYATHIKSNGFQRFSIAHELGHYFLPGHPEHVFGGGKIMHESQAGFGSGNQIELEADHFAAGLLMPAYLFKVEAGKYSDGFTAIEKLAERCETSLTASAIRYAELTDAAVAVIISTGSSVNYCFSSRSMRGIRGYKHPIKDSVLPRNSLTRTFNQTGSNIITAQREDDSADLIAWFRADDEIDASEEVLGLGDYGKTLTVITADLPDQDEAVKDMISFSPRFR
ncbi:MAG: ImmA/IrrE family metallo-endopeptidase [Pseudomonadota bacterium]